MSKYTGRHMGHGELFRGGNYYFEGPPNHGELFRGGIKPGGELKREIRYFWDNLVRISTDISLSKYKIIY
jgi:hypothetical protein